jgi:hypothetical protein
MRLIRASAGRNNASLQIFSTVVAIFQLLSNLPFQPAFKKLRFILIRPVSILIFLLFPAATIKTVLTAAKSRRFQAIKADARRVNPKSFEEV